MATGIDDLLTPENLAPLLPGTRFCANIHHRFRIDSTNAAAMEAAAQGAPEGAVYVSEEQLAGRGRGGHSWHSEPATGIYLSVVLRPLIHPSGILWLSLAAGLAAREAIQSVIGMGMSMTPDLRWPNDIMLGPRKLGGILAELSANMERVHYAVVGIGINVNQAGFPPGIAELATSLRLETGREWPRVEIAAALLKSLDREYSALCREPGQPIAAATIAERFEKQSSYTRGAHVYVEEGGGYTGTTAGLDERGFLRVQTAGGIRTVVSGGVRKL